MLAFVGESVLLSELGNRVKGAHMRSARLPAASFWQAVPCFCGAGSWETAFRSERGCVRECGELAVGSRRWRNKAALVHVFCRGCVAF